MDISACKGVLETLGACNDSGIVFIIACHAGTFFCANFVVFFFGEKFFVSLTIFPIISRFIPFYFYLGEQNELGQTSRIYVRYNHIHLPGSWFLFFRDPTGVPLGALELAPLVSRV